jgi:hypothetical protein
MKKVIAFLLLTIMCCFLLAACEETPDRATSLEDDTARFQYIGQSEVNANGAGATGDIVQFYVDNETSIVYVLILNRAGYGTWAGFTPLIDADGTYTTYEEFIKD